MRVFGIDFTSAPRAAKPITCAVCTLDNDHLVVDELRAWADFDRFESFLSETEPSITGIDLPFGQPRRFVQALGWPTVWEEYVKIVGVCRSRSLWKRSLATALNSRQVTNITYVRRMSWPVLAAL
jgi:hypothetical protein